ncbi:MAG: ABC transporter [Verrucomicrobia bacterium]|nr:ABC transporter [Verrucomicrobiota bacterium]
MSDAGQKAIEISGLSAGYRGVPVLKDLELIAGAGEMVAVLGPNGAGKTTLIRCLTGLCTPLAGRVVLFGKDNAAMSAPERARLVAVVPQELETPVAFTVQELVMVGRTEAISRWRAPSRADMQIVERAMAYTDVIDMRNRPLSELSGGERQRAVIAMALAQEPKLILMDEATSHLDMNHRIEVMQIVERLNREQGMTVVMISHDINLAAEFFPRLVLMDRGRIVADAAPAAVLTEEQLRRVYGCEVVVQKNEISGVVSVQAAPRLAPGCSGKGIRVHVIAGGGAGEEVVRKLVLCEYDVTCGVLNTGDSDAVLALALGLPVAEEKPFSQIGAQALEKGAEMVRAADAVIVCGAPFGPGNLPNLDLAADALAQGRKLFVMSGVADRDYTHGKEASARSAKLLALGAVEWSDTARLFEMLPRRKK